MVAVMAVPMEKLKVQMKVGLQADMMDMKMVEKMVD
jgi:hypothetical protein